MTKRESSLYALSGGRVGHPRFIALADRARDREGRPDSGSDDRLEVHLADCAVCRNELAFARRAAATARTMTGPRAAEELLDRVITQHRRGVRVELPTEHPTARRDRRVVAAASVAAAAVVMAIVVATSAREGTAGSASGTLRFSVPYARSGETVRVVYTPAGELAGEDSLLLRAQFRGRDDESYGRVARAIQVATILRPGDGSFSGSFRFPDSVVYAQFAVENSSASRVDRPGKWYWELLAASSEASIPEPSFDALMQQSVANLGANWDRAFAAVKAAVRRYPERAQGWQTLFFFERALYGERASDTLRAKHLPHLRAIDARLRAAGRPSAEEMNGQLFYAWSLGDSAITRYWRQRLVREWPASPEGVQMRLHLTMPALRADTSSPRREAEFDKLYSSVSRFPSAVRGKGSGLNRFGLDIAIAMKDSALVEKWRRRYLASQNLWSDSAYVSSLIVELPAFRASELDRLRHFLRTGVETNIARRPLWLTASGWREELMRRRANLFATIGKALVASGRAIPGADSLEHAASLHWTTSLFAEAAAVRLAAGDTAGAARDLARVAVDPAARRAEVDSLARVAGTPAQWNAWLDDARGEMRTVILAEGTRTPIQGKPRLTSLNGEEIKLASLTDGHPTVIAFWSRYCGPSLDELPQVEKLWRELRSRGIPFVAITDEPPSKELRDFLADKRLSFPVYLDTRREATHAFQNFGTPNYVILDAQGVIRFDQRELETIVRNAALLANELHSTN